MRGLTFAASIAFIAAPLLPLRAPAAELPAKDVARITEAAPAQATAKPAKPRKLLVFNLCKGFRHSSIPYAAKAVEVMGAKTGAYRTVVTDDVKVFAPERLKAFDAVVFNNCTGRIFPPPKDTGGVDLKRSLLSWLAAGGGIAGIHAATDGEMGAIIGGTFASHPWGKVPVKIDEPKHPLTAAFGGADFEVRDEIYVFRAPYSRERLRVLLSVDTSKMKLPAGRKPPRTDNDYAISWVARHGKGRIFYCSLGHGHHIYRDPKVLRHYLDGIQFALGDLPADTTPSRPAAVDKDGYIQLFNGKDLTGWTAKPGSWVIDEDGSVARKGGGSIWTEAQYGDFVLDLDFKVAKGTNSGIFIRTGSIRNSVQTGIEIQVLDSFGRAKPGKHDCGAVYDCLAPGKNPMKAPGQWNHAVITCKQNSIRVAMNGEQIIDMDLDKWTEPRKNPDGSRNKFRTALKDFPRRGHIGFQDHGKPVWYRNVRLKPLE